MGPRKASRFRRIADGGVDVVVLVLGPGLAPATDVEDDTTGRAGRVVAELGECARDHVVDLLVVDVLATGPGQRDLVAGDVLDRPPLEAVLVGVEPAPVADPVTEMVVP
jgi:hypothetical protein